MKVKDIGIKEVYSAETTSNLSEVAAMMKMHDVGCIPVCQNGRLVGILTDRDLVLSCMATGMEPDKCLAREFMTSRVVTIGPDVDVEKAAEIMGREQLHRLPVVDRDMFIGIISLCDVSMAIKNDSLVADTLRKISSPAQKYVSRDCQLKGKSIAVSA